MVKSFFSCLFGILFLSSLLIAQAPPVDPKNKPQMFDRQEIMVPVRDGVHLQTVIFTPKQASGPLPFLITRSPYGVPSSESRMVSSGLYDELIADGYIFVFQNIRGRFKSEGKFVMNWPPRDRSVANSVDEA